VAQGLGIGLRGFNADWLSALFGPLDDRQFGMGYGAMLTASAFLFLSHARPRGARRVNGDVFVLGHRLRDRGCRHLHLLSHRAKMLLAAFATEDGGYSIAASSRSSSTAQDLGPWLPVGRALRRGLELAVPGVLVGVLTTLLGLAFALVLTRTGFPYKRCCGR
jgi:iron(III) transport system permease protein